MEPIILWQQKWGTSFNVPVYLFLGGLAGGTLTIGALADLILGNHERFQRLARTAAYVAVPAILIGGLSLSFHLGKPERGFAFPLFFTNYQSWLTIGGWVVGMFGPVSLGYAAAWYFGARRRTRLVLAALGVPLGLIMSLYTGFLLSAAWVVPANRWYVPLWDSTYLPPLFTLSGLSTGLAACGLSILVGDAVRRWLGRAPRSGTAATAAPAAEAASLADALAILAEGSWLYVFLAALATGSVGQQLAFTLLTRGALSQWFWWGVVAVGLAAPLAVSLIHLVAERMLHLRWRWLLYAKFTLVLVGGLLLRYVVVWGGDLKTPLIFPPSMWQVPPVGGIVLPGVGG
jgi:formate-dependent nitrite reductase membrane component NrfD